MTLPLDHITQITLPTQLTDTQQRLLVKYTRSPRSLLREEWPLALAAFDLLNAGRVLCGAETLTFQRFYLRVIDEAHATNFIEGLLAAHSVGWMEANLPTLPLKEKHYETKHRPFTCVCIHHCRSVRNGERERPATAGNQTSTRLRSLTPRVA